MSIRIPLLTIAILAAVGIASAAPVNIALTNPLPTARPNAVVVASAEVLGVACAPGAMTANVAGRRAFPLQADDLDGDGAADEISMVLDLPAQTSVTVTVHPDLPWQEESFTDARIGWRYEDYAVLDTDRAAYGLYGVFSSHFKGCLQWDCYGKRPEAWGLSLDALDGVNYHEDNDVAVDYLIVGHTLALGGVILGDGRPVHGENATYEQSVICTGPVRGGIRVEVTDFTTPSGGRYELTARYFIYAHNDFLDVRYELRSLEGKPERFGAGIRKFPDPGHLLRSPTEGILAIWGPQEGIIGEAGLAVIFSPTRFQAWTDRPGEEGGHAFFLNPPLQGREKVEYQMRYVGAWEHGGVATKETFIPHLQELAERFHQPVSVSVR